MKKLTTAFISALVILTSCTSSVRKNRIVLMDISLSVPQKTIDKYISIVTESVLPGMRENDCLTLNFIDGCALIKSERIFSIDLSSMSFTKPGDGLNHKKDSTKARINQFLIDTIAGLKRMLIAKRTERKQCQGLTDILNAITEATSLIRNDQSYSTKLDKAKNDAQGKSNYKYETTIIILSDMINEDAEHQFDFTKLGSMTTAQILEILDRLRKNNQIPVLENTSVFISGATSSKNEKNPNKQIQNIKLFWQEYFKTAGADLKAYSYDAEKEIKDYAAK